MPCKERAARGPGKAPAARAEQSRAVGAAGREEMLYAWQCLYERSKQSQAHPGKNGDSRDGGAEPRGWLLAGWMGHGTGIAGCAAAVTCYSGTFWPWSLPLFSFWNSHYRRVTLMHSHVLLLGTKSALVAIYFFHAFFSSFAGTLGVKNRICLRLICWDFILASLKAATRNTDTQTHTDHTHTLNTHTHTTQKRTTTPSATAGGCPPIHG